MKEKKRKDLVECLKEAEANQKMAETSLKHHETEKCRLKEELSQEKDALEAARCEISDLKA